MTMPSQTIKSAVASEKAQDAKVKDTLSAKAPNIAKQQEGMRQTAGEQNWDQAWKDVKKARSQGADAYRKNRQERSSQRHQ